MEKEAKNKGRNKGHENLIPCKPGETANPNGRPKGQRNYATIYREALIKLATANGKTPDDIEVQILSKGLQSASNGDYRFYKDILDRLYGTPVSRTELTGKDGEALIPDTDIQSKIDESINKYINGNKGNTKQGD